MAKALLTDEEKRLRKNERERKYNATNRERIQAQRKLRYERRKASDPKGLAASRREEKLRQRYGMTASDYNDMLSAQAFKCAICWTEAEQLVVDHCHDTMAVRGLLCSACNISLGGFKDDAAALARAAEYIRCAEKKH